MKKEKLSIGKHRPELKGQIHTDREIIHAIEFAPNGTFSAISAAEVYLKELGYTIGSMCSQEPIGFAHGFDYVAKWYNISNPERDQLDGIIVPKDEFREGGALIIFFTTPRY